MLPVVDQFRGLDVIDDFLQSRDSRTRIVKKKIELGYIAKQVGFKFMQLDKRNKAPITSLIKPRPFQSLYSLVRDIAQFLSFFNTGKFACRA